MIYLVDDDRDFLEMEKAILTHGGYRTKCFSESREALEALGSAVGAEKPALVVTDLMMKSLVASQKGFDFRPRTAEDLAAMHADAFFDKPVSPAAFLARVKELIG